MKFCKYKKTIMENKKIIEISISFQVVKFISKKKKKKLLMHYVIIMKMIVIFLSCKMFFR
jgi:hypothetical protein